MERYTRYLDWFNGDLTGTAGASVETKLVKTLALIDRKHNLVKPPSELNATIEEILGRDPTEILTTIEILRIMAGECRTNINGEDILEQLARAVEHHGLEVFTDEEALREYLF